MNVGELKEIIKDLDDNMEIIHRSDNYELKDSYVSLNKYSIRPVDGYKREIQTFRDDFDGECYQTPVYVYDKENGKTVLIL